MSFAHAKVFEGEFSAAKYQSKNPIARYLVNGFLKTVTDLAQQTGVKQAHEIGCGEGQITGLLKQHGFDIRGCDFDETALMVAKQQAKAHGLSIPFEKGDIYNLNQVKDTAPLVLCCEVLEHLEKPEAALQNLCDIADPYLIVSVPREPLWRALNMARGKYWSDLGNTPTHIQHWSTQDFMQLVSRYVDVIEVRTPIPWTVLLCRKR
jgi:2-polyprenyl-3-methyl-5-hydroxy-6-metoxy-1,4-benzoquinol methylase